MVKTTFGGSDLEWGLSPKESECDITSNTLLPIVGQKRYTIGTWIANGDTAWPEAASCDTQTPPRG